MLNKTGTLGCGTFCAGEALYAYLIVSGLVREHASIIIIMNAKCCSDMQINARLLCVHDSRVGVASSDQLESLTSSVGIVGEGGGETSLSKWIQSAFNVSTKFKL